MNYLALKWAVEKCRLDSAAAKSIVFVTAYRADRDTGEWWVSQRRLAREAGVTRKTVERWVARLVELGVYEPGEEGSGPQPNHYRFAPGIVEGGGTASGIVEGGAVASGIVEGEATSSGDMVTPVGRELVATSGSASGDMVSPQAGLVATFDDDSGYSHVPLSSEDAEKVLIKGSSLQVKNHVVDERAPLGGAPVADMRNPSSPIPLETLELLRAVRERDPGATFNPGTEWRPWFITLSDGSTLPNANRVREWLGDVPSPRTS